MLTMKNLMRLFSLLTVLLMAACSGGGGSNGACQFNCTPGGGTAPPGAVASELDVQLSPGTIVNNGTATATATITALDANRAAISGVPIIVSVDTGLVTVGNGGKTDASGKLVATVSAGSNLALRKITLTAEAGTVKRTNTVQVVDSPTSAKPTSLELIANATAVGTGGDGVVVRAFVKDANNNALPGSPVSFSTSTGTLATVSTVTDPGGAAAATLFAGADKSNRVATVTVTAGTITSTLKVPVNGTKLTLSGPSSLILGNSAQFDVAVVDSKANPVPNVAVTGVSSLGNALTASSPTTDSNGNIRFTYAATKSGTDNLAFSGVGASVSPVTALVVSGQDFAFSAPAASTKVAVNTTQAVTVLLRSGGVPQAGATINFAATGGTLSAPDAVTNSAGQASVNFSSSSAGPVTVQATVAGGGATQTVTTLPLVVIATVPSKLVLQISPTALPPNLGTSATNQAKAVAKVTDAAGNPVEGVVVNFTRIVDPSGGELLQASATTDASGQATASYKSGSQSTANNGVVLGAAVANALNVTGQANLTVNQSALFIALGTGNVITNLDPQTYNKDWVTYVTDANGIAVNGVTLTIKAVPISYLVGRLAWSGTVWTYAKGLYECRNEDANGNGILDTGEDDNKDNVLWPGNVIAVTPSTVQTVNGRALISLQYGESYAPWVRLLLTASATVSGTESKTTAQFVVDGFADDFNKETVPPAGVVSPYGQFPSPAALTSGACKLIF
jgi:Bacterial Ig-like domain (group 1)